MPNRLAREAQALRRSRSQGIFDAHVTDLHALGGDPLGDGAERKPLGAQGSSTPADFGTFNSRLIVRLLLPSAFFAAISASWPPKARSGCGALLLAGQDDEVSIVVGSDKFSWPSVSITRSTDLSFSIATGGLQRVSLGGRPVRYQRLKRQIDDPATVQAITDLAAECEMTGILACRGA